MENTINVTQNFDSGLYCSNYSRIEMCVSNLDWKSTRIDTKHLFSFFRLRHNLMKENTTEINNRAENALKLIRISLFIFPILQTGKFISGLVLYSLHNIALRSFRNCQRNSSKIVHHKYVMVKSNNNKTSHESASWLLWIARKLPWNKSLINYSKFTAEMLSGCSGKAPEMPQNRYELTLKLGPKCSRIDIEILHRNRSNDTAIGKQRNIPTLICWVP